MPGAKPIGVSPTIVVALSNDERTQARISIESKTSVYGPKKKEQIIDEAISLSCTIRQYPETFENFDAIKSFNHQCRIAEELMTEKIIPGIVLPLTETIAQKRLT